MKANILKKALMQFAEEGAAKVFKPTTGSGFIVGVVGALQFEVSPAALNWNTACLCGLNSHNLRRRVGFLGRKLRWINSAMQTSSILQPIMTVTWFF